ncbi:MAG: ACP S-malonyltransferase [Lachnospiraceae bacterium]|nr:ACP S-malonyltransferase [Lachnospiraceae bacterium]
MGKIAFLYPGQGAQKTGMGKDFYEQCQASKAVYDRISSMLNLDMPAICFEENDLLDQTEYTQAALATTCLAMNEMIKELGLIPSVTAGLSLGEYCAIAAAGGMDYEDAVMTVRKRGILMEKAIPKGRGTMAAVLGMSVEKIETVLDGRANVTVANYNCPGQVVITGLKEAVEEAAEELKQAGARKLIWLNVSGPFHSPLLKRAGEKLADILKTVKLHPLRIPYVTNVTADFIQEDEKIKNLLTKQVTSSVRWEQSIRKMIADGVDTFVEIGPGTTLTGFVKKIDRGVKTYHIGTVEEAYQTVEAMKKAQ